MSIAVGADNTADFEPSMGQARQTALLAHGVVIKLKEMGLPPALDRELASVSTDLGDLWGAQKALAKRLEGMLKSSDDWRAIGDSLVDLRAEIEHIAWHLNSVRRPLTRITHFAYKSALESEKSSEGSESPGSA